jgi:hypothetical protein
MQGEKDISYLSAIREVMVIGIIKVVLAVIVFAFSTVITETIKIYFFQVDSWLTDNSQAVSRKVLDLYR